MKLNILTYDSVIKLNQDFELVHYNRFNYNNGNLLCVIFGKNWLNTVREGDKIIIPKDTILSIKKVNIKTQFKINDFIEFKILETSMPEFKFTKGKVKSSFSAFVRELQGIDVEFLNG